MMMMMMMMMDDVISNIDIKCVVFYLFCSGTDCKAHTRSRRFILFFFPS